MKTPWGPLSRLDQKNYELAAEILSADKHQLLEGLVVECLFDQIVMNIQSVTDKKVISLDIDSVVVDTGRELDRWIGLVWARKKEEGLGRYLILLEKCLVPYLVTYKNGDFMVVLIREGKKSGPERPLTELMEELSNGKYVPFSVDISVRDKNRQRQAFWGFISDYYKERLWERVILPRILINCGIQPYFRAVWNLDRIVIIENDIWLFEIKHKYPMRKKSLSFGINVGELGVIDRLTDAGIHCLHTILVKPFWSKDVSSLYLLNDLNLRTKAAIIATVLDKSVTSQMLGQKPGKSGVHTSISGCTSLKYKTINSNNFKALGVISDPPSDLADKMYAVMAGLPVSSAQDKWLSELKTL
ncbi:hypothetical protein [Pectobacterium punjabense]|uniref:hypothetical protein n=1 Tax=Pectobacterium punjabense TaxID=2108399 RepID=UPI003D9BD611